MKKIYLLILLQIILSFLVLSAQIPDSLLKQLQYAKEPKNKVEILYKIRRTLKNINPMLADSCLEEAYKLSKSANFKKGLAKYHYYKGANQYENNDYSSAIRNFELSLEYFGKLPQNEESDIFIEDMYKLIAFSARKLTNNDKTMKYLMRSADIYLKKGKIDKLVITLYSLGHQHLDEEDYYNALSVFSKGLNHSISINDTNQIASFYGMIGLTYSFLNNLESAKHNLFKGYNLLKSSNDKEEIAKNLLQIADIYYKEENYPVAIKYLEQAIALAKTLDDENLVAVIQTKMGDTYLSAGDCAKAIKLLKDAQLSNLMDYNENLFYSNNILLAKAYILAGTSIDQALELLNKSLNYTQDKGIAYLSMYAFEVLSMYYESAGDHKSAMQALRKHYLYKDSLLSPEKMKKLGELEAKFEMKDELNRLEKENEEKAQSNREEYILYGLSSVVALLSVFVVILWKMRKKSERMRQFGNTLVDISPNMLYIFDIKTSKMTILGSGIQTMLGYSKEDFSEISPQVLSEMVHPEDLANSFSIEKPRYESTKDNEIIKYNVRVKHKDGYWKWLDVAEVVYTRDTEGKPAELFGSAHDITDIIKASYELEKAKNKAEESDMLKTSFLQNISHEIRTPLNGIMGFTELAQSDDLNENIKKDCLKNIMISANRLNVIVESVLDLSKLETNQLEANLLNIEISEIISEICKKFKSIAAEKKLDFICLKPIGETLIKVDKILILKALSHILDNALKFTSSGSIAFWTETNSEEVRFIVQDSGIGIKQEHFSLIFDKFSQVDSSLSSYHEGAGIGLTLAKGFTALFGGRIEVASVEGKGSTFSIILPVAKGIQVI